MAHIEELPAHAFIRYVREIEHVSISEKLDGANLQVGIDNNGFYTSRGAKGGDKQYTSDGLWYNIRKHIYESGPQGP